MQNVHDKVHVATGSICDIYRVTVDGQVRALKGFSIFRLKKIRMHGYRGQQSGMQILENEIAILSFLSTNAMSVIAEADDFDSDNQYPILKYYGTIRDEDEGLVCIISEYLSFGKSMTLQRELISSQSEAKSAGNDDEVNYLLRYSSYKHLLAGSESDGEILPPCTYFSESDALVLFSDLIKGITFLHSKGVAHLDIKPENLLITSTHRLKITDFGSAVHFDLTENPHGIITHTPGTPAFWPPSYVRTFEDHKEVELEEIFSSENFEPTSDIQFAVVSSEDMSTFEREDEGVKSSAFSADLYSAGVTLYCFLHGRLPFCETSAELYPANLYMRILKKAFLLSDDLKEKSAFILKLLLPITGEVQPAKVRKQILDDIHIALSLDV
jgi:serine/threonine protein kinase